MAEEIAEEYEPHPACDLFRFGAVAAVRQAGFVKPQQHAWQAGVKPGLSAGGEAVWSCWAAEHQLSQLMIQAFDPQIRSVVLIAEIRLQSNWKTYERSEEKLCGCFPQRINCVKMLK